MHIAQYISESDHMDLWPIAEIDNFYLSYLLKQMPGCGHEITRFSAVERG